MFIGTWLPFGNVFLDIVDFRVWCEGDYSSLYVVSFVVYGGAAHSVYDHPECGSFLGGIAVFLSGVFRGLH